MTFSFSMVAFAAESEKNTNIAISEVATEQNNRKTMPTMEASSYSYYSGWYEGYTRTTYTIQFNVPYQGKMNMVASSDSPIRVTLYKDGVEVGKGYYTEKDGKGTHIPIVKNGTLNDNVWASGNYTAKVEILFDRTYSFQIYTLGKLY